MSTATATATQADTQTTASTLRHGIVGGSPDILADIYQEDANIVVWQRSLPQALSHAADTVLAAHPRLRSSLVVSPQDAEAALIETLGDTVEATTLSQDIAQLLEMFCCLFDLRQAGLRLTALDRAMCPRFHVDRVPCRLVSTYQGVATEWLPQTALDRQKLGRGSQGLPDEQSGLFQSKEDIRQLTHGDVALLKGELWPNNEGAGLVHRSPSTQAGQHRLLLTLDFIGG